MVKHVILWKLKDDIADKASVKAGIKSGLEGLRCASGVCDRLPVEGVKWREAGDRPPVSFVFRILRENNFRIINLLI